MRYRINSSTNITIEAETEEEALEIAAETTLDKWDNPDIHILYEMLSE